MYTVQVDYKDGSDAVHKLHVQVDHDGDDYHVQNDDDENKTNTREHMSYVDYHDGNDYEHFDRDDVNK